MKRIVLLAMLFLIFTSFMSLHAQWARTYGRSVSDYSLCIEQTDDGGYIVVGITSSFSAETCNNCGAKFTQSDIYGGNYDYI